LVERLELGGIVILMDFEALESKLVGEAKLPVISDS
jgi:hypothetical protein